MTEKRVMGIDASLNHSAVTLLVNGKLKNYAYYTKTVAAAKQSPNGTRLVVATGKNVDIQRSQMARLAWCEAWFKGVLERMQPTHVAMEDYALGTGRGGHYTGELGGLIRMLLWKSGVYFRLHDPATLKMFTCWDGSAEKTDMEEAVARRWRIRFDKLNAPAKGGKVAKREVSADMADAYALAQLCLLETQLREGQVELKSLHPKEIQAFSRCTKMYPISLLGREWIKKE